MKNKFEKNLRIINELMNYIYKLGAKNININFNEEDTSTNFVIWGNITSLSEEKLDELKLKLNTERIHEVEEYYWHLGGDSEVGEELSLIGMMIDKVDIKLENGLLYIKISRNDF